MKRLLAMLLAVTMLLTLCACKNKSKSEGENASTSTTRTPIPIGDKEIYAENFITAYMMRDMLTRLPMYCYDARAKWEAERIAENGDIETFLKVAQENANEKNSGYTFNSVDEYFAGYRDFIVEEYLRIYGTYTTSATAISCEKQDAETVAKTIDGVFQAVDKAYLDVDAINAITEAYTITVEWKVDGELKDYTEHKQVQVVLYKGEWRVASHSI